ncbi:MAG: hypothetical protein MAG795_00309 [Candidatus Woesearchaeota archaeon]|nr:hypothetical protein [Candidatus Woesearchaeota archaeon]
MRDILFLEDNKDQIRYLNSILPRYLEKNQYLILENSQELEEWLAEGNKAKMYILDDKVPHKPDALPGYLFTVHYDLISETHPDAQVFYAGSSPRISIYDFCEENGICMITGDEGLETVLSRLDN